MSLAVSCDGRYVATACKSTSPENAAIRIYDTSTWELVGQPLVGHSSTVTRIRFNRDNRAILSVSRDRSWMVSVWTESQFVLLLP